MKTMRVLMMTLAAAGLAVCLGSAAWAQSSADPTGTAPIGIEEKPGAKGPSLNGVLVIELINPGLGGADPDAANSARMVARVRRGSTLKTFFADLPGPISFADKAAFQADVMAAFFPEVFDEFFNNDCGNVGSGCVLVLKQADEFGLTDNGLEFPFDSQFILLDVTVALAQPLAP